MPRRRPRSISPSPPSARRPPPGLRDLRIRDLPPRLTTHQILHRIIDQRCYITWLIAAYGPHRQVSFSLASDPCLIIIDTLQNCLSIGEIVVGGRLGTFTLVGPLPPCDGWV